MFSNIPTWFSSSQSPREHLQTRDIPENTWTWHLTRVTNVQSSPRPWKNHWYKWECRLHHAHTLEYWEQWRDIDQDHVEILVVLHLTIVAVDTQICRMIKVCNFQWMCLAKNSFWRFQKILCPPFCTSSNDSPQVLHLSSSWSFIFWITELFIFLLMCVKCIHFSVAACKMLVTISNIVHLWSSLLHYPCIFCIYLPK